MPPLPRRILDAVTTKHTAPVNRFEGFTASGQLVLRDRRGTRKAEIPDIDEKSFGGSDPLVIYKPAGAKEVRDAYSASAQSSKNEICHPKGPVSFASWSFF
jgi:hypothetical protein